MSAETLGVEVAYMRAYLTLAKRNGHTLEQMLESVPQSEAARVAGRRNDEALRAR